MFILLGPDSEGQGVCPAAQRGHFHLNRGPRVPAGVTLATVKAIVPAVSECEKEKAFQKIRVPQTKRNHQSSNNWTE